MTIIRIPVPGLRYVPRYLTAEEQDELLAAVDEAPWSCELKRRVQHYGYRYYYRRASIDRNEFLGQLPYWAAALAGRLLREHYAPRRLNQLIVNEYTPGQGIAAHIDCAPCFADTILSVSLGSSCALTLTLAARAEQYQILLDAGSLLVLADEARYQWAHGIPARRTDRIAGRTIVRDRRVSLTFRTVLSE